ncbi:MAG: phospho-N-acetylmuramoyl-pentapeptide-transferase [Planctomycetota bacterium]|nr:phospho-N-acetylmuramoyl-pentapeptide-transferase [Planctomycetota bacterium]
MSGLIAVFLLPIFIRLLKARGLIEPDKDFQGLSPSSKRGTPIMGGVVVMLASFAPPILLAKLDTAAVQVILFSAMFFGCIGLLDDVLKAKNSRRGVGLSAVQKYSLQFVGALIVLFVVGRMYSHDNSVKVPYVIPFLMTPFYLGTTAWFTIGTLLIIFFTNSTNITDGMDGLLSFPAAILSLTLAIISLIHNRQPSNPEVSIVLTAFAGAFLGFLWHNSYPASVFLGDTGSLMIGASLSSAAIVLRLELILLIGGFLFVVQGLSSVIQSYLGVALLGRRIFFRAPLHHTWHFSGLSEPKIVIRMWLFSLLCAILATCSLLVHLD